MENFVERYLRENPHGERRHYCKVCKVLTGKTLKKMEEGLRTFNEARRTTRTTMSWESFYKYVVKPEFSDSPSFKSLRNHLEKCLDETVF